MCGAPNVEKGMKVVYAPVGSIIPVYQMKIKAAKIRGVESFGMMCSEYELGISNEHDGIIHLNENEKVGTSFAKISGLNDIVIEIGITPNRQDCLGVNGIARDLAAAGMGELIDKKIINHKGSFKSPIKIEIKDKTACPAFAGRYFRNVKNVESPGWLKNKVKSIGLRPISALVDITNFVMFDLNRPLHVYDADKINGKIIVRSAKDGESFLALDEINNVMYKTDFFWSRKYERCIAWDDQSIGINWGKNNLNILKNFQLPLELKRISLIGRK